MNLKTTRRRMLALTAAFPALNFMKSLDAQAQGNSPRAKRLLVMYHANGSSGQHWYGNTSETNFTLAHTLKPLERVKEHMLICKNVDNQMACDYWNQAPRECRARGLNKVDQHCAATNTILAPFAPRGVHKNGGKTFSFPGGESLDWTIGKTLQKRYGTPHDALFFTPGNSGGKHTLDVYSVRENAGGKLEDMEPETNPVAMYQKYLAGAKENNGANTGNAVADDTANRKALLRSLVTNFAAEEVIHFQKSLPSEFRDNFDAHIGELRSLESRLTDLSENGAPNNADNTLCTVINPPNDGTAGVQTAGKGKGVGNYRARADVMSDFAVSALSCGVAPVVNLAWWTFKGNCSPVNIEGTKSYGDLHLGLQHNRNGYKPQDTADAHQHLALQVARIIDKMSQIPEGDGTMLDNTLVLWTSCLGMNPFDGKGHHNKYNIPFIMAGAGIPSGRLIDFERINHVRMLSAVTHLMGMPMDTVGGDAQYSQDGPANQLLI